MPPTNKKDIEKFTKQRKEREIYSLLRNAAKDIDKKIMSLAENKNIDLKKLKKEKNIYLSVYKFNKLAHRKEKGQKMRMFLLDAEKQEAREVDISPDLESYYKILHCNLISVTERKINGIYYDIVADEEGLLKEEPTISAITEEGKAALVGNLLIQRYNSEKGSAEELTPEDIENIKQRIARAEMQSGDKIKVVVLDKGEDF